MLQVAHLLNAIIFILSCRLPTSIYAGSADYNGSLRFVHVVWRHGDRSPSDPTFPTDTGNPEWSWPQGWGELTELGVKQQIALGAYLRKRYVDSGFLSSSYNVTQIYVRTSNYNRTIMSATANMAGMYPAGVGGIAMAVPVHSVSGELDAMLWMDRPCPKAEDVYFNGIVRSRASEKVKADHSELLKFLRVKTGLSLVTLDDMRLISDPLNCERIHNDTHKWPSWVNWTLYDQIDKLHRIALSLLYGDPRIQRFRGSLLLSDIAQRSEKKAKRKSDLKPSQLKYYAYSTQDVTMQALLENLGAFDGRIPDYASAIMFELHERNHSSASLTCGRLEGKRRQYESWPASFLCTMQGEWICKLRKIPRRRSPSC